MFAIHPPPPGVRSRAPDNVAAAAAAAPDEFARTRQIPRVAPAPTPAPPAPSASTAAAAPLVGAALRALFVAAGGDLARCQPRGLDLFARGVARMDELPEAQRAAFLPWVAAACEAGEDMLALSRFLRLAGPLPHGEVDPFAELARLEPTLRGQSRSMPVWTPKTQSTHVYRAHGVMQAALAWRLPHDTHLPGWEPAAAESFLHGMAKCQKDAATSLRLVQLARHNGLNAEELLRRALPPTCEDQAESWLQLICQLSAPEQRALTANSSFLACLPLVAPLASCLTCLENLGESIDARPLSASLWKGMAPTAAATPEAAVRWLRVLPRRAPCSNDWSNALAILLPETHWQLLARSMVQGHARHSVHAWPSSYRERGAALLACLHATPLDEAPQDPELELVRDSAACVQRGDWSAVLHAFNQPAWLQDLLQKETPRTDREAARAQENRLQSLGRMLYLHRCAGLDANAEPSPSVAQILAHVPSHTHRQLLLKDYLQLLLGAYPDFWKANVAQLLQTYTSPESRVLALVLEMHTPSMTRTPHVQALLSCSALTRQGQAWQRLFNLFADADQDTAEFGVEVACWATGDNLLRMLPEAMRTDSPLALIQAWAQEQTPERANALRVQCQRSDNTSKVAAALIADCHRHGAASLHIAGYLQGERQRLQHSVAWLAEQPGCHAMAAALQALLQQPAPGMLAATTRPAAKTLNANITAARATVRQVGKQQPTGPLRDWAELLGKQIERCLPAPPRASRLSQNLPSAEFFTQLPVRQFLNQHVLEMVLVLEQFAAIFQQQGVQADSLHSPAAATRRALPMFGAQEKTDKLWQQIRQKIYQPENFLLYAGSAARWCDDYRALGQARLRQLTGALLDGTYDAMRRASGQMQQLLKADCNPPWLLAWETDTPQQSVANGPPLILVDTADAGKILHASTEIFSCQSVTGGRDNVGTLGRLLCGSKRMLLGYDSAGKLTLRAMLRLLSNEQGHPVLALSKIYTAHPYTHKEAVEAYVIQRAESLGLRAARTCDALSNVRGEMRLHCVAAELPDYWDETQAFGMGLTRAAQVVLGQFFSEPIAAATAASPVR